MINLPSKQSGVLALSCFLLLSPCNAQGENGSQIREDPAARAAWQRRIQQDENGRIPADAIVKAYQQKKEMPFRQESWREFLPAMGPNQSSRADAGGISPSVWTWKGPGNIGGRMRALVFHPTNHSIMWLGGITGGIWKTTNGGASWNTTSDFIADLSVGCLALDPTNPDVIYAGTGETRYSVGAGIFKTTDGGATWTQLPRPYNMQFVTRIAIPANNPKLLLAASYWGIFRSADGGETWNRVVDGDFGPHFEQVVFHPTDGSKCLAAGYGTVMYSANAGLDWVAATGLPASAWRIELAYAPSNLSIVYASVDHNGRHIYRSTDGGQSFNDVGGAGTGDNGYDGYANALWVDPTNAETLVVGGIELWRSTNGGVNFVWIRGGSHVDEHVIVSHPNFNGSTNKTVYLGNDGGIYRTNDIYTAGDLGTPYPHGWIALNHNLGITQLYAAAGNINSGTILAGSQDNGAVRLRVPDAINDWMAAVGGDVVACAADQTDSNYFYATIGGMQILRSTDGGASASFERENISGLYFSGQWRWKPDPYRIPDVENGVAGFGNAVILDPNNPNRILAGAISLWRTNDAKTPNTNTSGPSWASIKPPLASPTRISALAIAPGNSDFVWVGYEDGSIYYTEDGTVSNPAWTQANLGSPALPERSCLRIVIDPRDSNKVYVTLGGFTTDNVWRTTDKGLNWTNISNGLPSAPVRTLVVSPTDSDVLYLGGDVGVFASSDAGATWSPSNDGPANVVVSDLLFMGPQLVAATYGRGLFTATPTPSAPTFQPLNISTRMRVLSGEQVLIAGFIVNGTESKKLIVRGIGPSLPGVGKSVSDPTLQLYQRNTVLFANDNWKIKSDGGSQQAEVQATNVPPTHDLESAIVATLSPGVYTAVLAGKNGDTGIGMVEVYDLAQGANSKLANISTRGFVDVGDNVMIGGFIIGGTKGTAPARVLARAIGPSLGALGIQNALADPVLTLHDGNGTTLAANDNWKLRSDGTSQQTEIEVTTIPPGHDLEAAILRSVAPGNYTVIVRGQSETTGVGLVEVYNLQQ